MMKHAVLIVLGVVMLTAAGCRVAAQQAGTTPRAVVPMLAADSAAGGFPQCVVMNVVDGDTIDVGGCSDAGRVRLILVDAPEVSGGARCYSREATNYVTSRLLGRTVGLERDVSNVDRFGRYLRYIWLDGELFNETMVREGYAALAVYPPDVKYRDRIAAAEAEARAANRGLWGACGGLNTPATPTPTTPGTATPTVTSTPTPPATPTPGGTCATASARITLLDKDAEFVRIEGSGNLTGWYLISEKGNQKFDFPPGFVLNGQVAVWSGVPQFPNTPTRLWWSASPLWNNNSDDDALLYDCTGRLVQRFDDGD
jgi:endonuclease YncB( thermonuclease family)